VGLEAGANRTALAAQLKEVQADARTEARVLEELQAQKAELSTALQNQERVVQEAEGRARLQAQTVLTLQAEETMYRAQAEEERAKDSAMEQKERTEAWQFSQERQELEAELRRLRDEQASRPPTPAPGRLNGSRKAGAANDATSELRRLAGELRKRMAGRHEAGDGGAA